MKIIGNSVGAPVPRTDYSQTDPTRSDYLIGRELLEQKISAAAQAAQAAADKALPKTGGTMAGPIKMDGNKLTGLAEPLSATDAVTRQYADACRDNAKDYADTVAAEARQQTDARVRAAAPYNLLDNSDFTNVVNQRGEDEYYGKKSYTIDRWIAVATLRLTVAAGYVSIKNEASGYGGFTQYLNANYPLKTGEVYTAALKLRGGDVFCGAVTITEKEYDRAILMDSGATVRFYGPTNRLIIMFAPGDRLDIEWVAVYKGEYTAETLPAYRQKGYTAELAACQRCFRVLRNASGYVSSINAYIFAPYNMRTTPTATAKRLGTVRTQGKSVTPTSVSETIKYIGEGIRLTMPGEYGSSNHAAALYDAEIWLSADYGEVQ